jgi:hypothetical protein
MGTQVKIWTEGFEGLGFGTGAGVACRREVYGFRIWYRCRDGGLQTGGLRVQDPRGE